MSGDEKHDAAAFSTLDVLWTLYDGVLDVAPDRLDDPDRDRFLLSKGHGPMAYYAVLAAKGFIDPAELDTWLTFGSRLGGHPDGTLVPGVEISSGSLGHGLGLAVGTALGLRMQGRTKPRVVVLVGDGELDEGSNAEAIQYAATRRPGQPHRRRDRQRVGRSTAGPGGIAGTVRGRGLALDRRRRAQPRDACARRSKPLCRNTFRTSSSPTSSRRRRHECGDGADQRGDGDDARAVLPARPRAARRRAGVGAGAGRDRRAATSTRGPGPGWPTGSSTSASASSSWSAWPVAWP